MGTALEHYESLLADHYSWMHGDFDARRASAAAWFREHSITSPSGALAIDLGAGAGCHSLALADVGYRVRALDFSPKLVSEIAERTGSAKVEPVHADITDFSTWGSDAPELIVTMGDTLTHLASIEQVRTLFAEVHRRLVKTGRFVITYRDLATTLTGVDRFIPVRSDADRIFTCFLEYGEDRVEVHDLVHVRTPSGWKQTASSYSKLRLARESVTRWLTSAGFAVEHAEVTRGMTEIAARA